MIDSDTSSDTESNSETPCKVLCKTLFSDIYLMCSFSQSPVVIVSDAESNDMESNNEVQPMPYRV